MWNWIKAIITATWALLAPIHTVMITTGVLILVDLILGVWSAVKRKEAVSSAGLRRTVTKIALYQLAVITGFLCEKYLLEGFIPISKLVASAIGLVEMKSILENADVINGSPLFASLINKLGSSNDNEQDK